MGRECGGLQSRRSRCPLAPPSPVPGRNEPRRRMGSAVSAGACRKVTVSMPVSWNSSWRTAYLRSSRTEGMVKSSRDVRLAPRSRPTTLSPALVTSRARIAPVQPTPITTASVSLSIVAIVLLLPRDLFSVGPTLGFVHDPSAHHRHQRGRLGDARLLRGERVGAQHGEIGELADLKRALLAFVECKIRAVGCGTAQCI